jgi:two-component system OmpR family response regulator
VRLLVVEDDVKLVRALERGLQQEGYAVDVAHTGDAALEQSGRSAYDAVILDLMLPGVDGFTVCRTLRERGRSDPVLMLTARADVGDRIRGLDSGADDYLVKPFHFGELLARLRALIRRGPSEPPGAPDAGGLQLDAETRTVTRDGREVELTPREFALLGFLVERGGQVVTRPELLAQVWEEHEDASPNLVDVYVGYLRKKLEQPSGPRLIRTVRGVGFMLETT